VSGCGGSNQPPQGARAGAPISPGKTGGAVTFLASGDVDHLDPGQMYYAFTYMVHYAVNRTLYSFKPNDGEHPVPDLAEGDPEVSADNRTITIRIRRGVRFAPPVDREVTARDVKYGIERAFTSNVPSGYATSYFSEIDGAPSEPVAMKDLRSFRGLETPDDHTLVIKLTEPVGPRVAAALVMPITTPVPEEYASRFDRKSPSEYDQYVAFTGPYMVEHDERTGELSGHQPGKRIELVRNPNWAAETDYRPALFDRITIHEGNNDLTVASRRTLSGERLMCCDVAQPPTPILRRALADHTSQLAHRPNGGTFWVALNTVVKPLDNLNVRKAIVAGVDRTALRQTVGGSAVGVVAQHFLPPGIPGHEESGARDGFTQFDWMRAPGGDARLAARYMRAAGEQGVPVHDGRYAGTDKILTIAANAGSAVKTAEVLQAELAKLGIQLKLRLVPPDTMLTKFCGVPKAQVAICPNVGWFRDFVDPQSLLEPTFAGRAIRPAGNVNWSQLDDAAIDGAMSKAALLAGAKGRSQAWADINRDIVAQAPAIPYLWGDNFQLQSSDLDGVMNSYFGAWDLSFSGLK